MPEGTEARWFSLGDAADLFSRADNARHTFDDLLAAVNAWKAFDNVLTSGVVLVVGKREGRLQDQPIEELLRRAACAPSVVDIEIDPGFGQVKLSLTPDARNRLTYSDVEPQLEALVADVFGARWRKSWLYMASHLIFSDVRVEQTSLIDAAASAGYTVAPASRVTPPRAISSEFDKSWLFGKLPAAEAPERDKSQPEAGIDDGLSAADKWMRDNFHKGDKRNSAIMDCRVRTGATWREALTAYQQLPDWIKRRRGDKDRPSK